VIEGTLCSLRPWSDADIPSLVRHADDPAVARFLRDRFPQPYTADDGRRWIAINRTIVPATAFAIVVEGAACGGVGITPGSDVERAGAEIGYWLGQAYWGRGIATEALALMSDYAFATFPVLRLWAVVFEGNPASERVLEKAGYACEGVLRQAAIKDGRVFDLTMFALLRDEHEARARRAAAAD
jgi:RimJ/RimL family protein N-acetyltransferase